MIGYGLLLRYFIPLARDRSLKNADTRSVLVARVVDTYTNALTVKLFARSEDERASVREALARNTRGLSRSRACNPWPLPERSR